MEKTGQKTGQSPFSSGASAAPPFEARRQPKKVTVPVFLALALAAGPALGQGSPAAGPGPIIQEAVSRLPQPLRGFFEQPGALDRMAEAAAAAPVTAPEQKEDEDEKQAEGAAAAALATARPRCVFHLDALAPEFTAPFDDLPRDREELAKRVGRDRLENEVGTGPWQAAEGCDRLARAMAEGPEDAAFREAGRLAACIADLHMPLNTSGRYGASASGPGGANGGLQAAVEIGLLVRYPEFYEAELRSGRGMVRYVEGPLSSVFDGVLAAHARLVPVVEAAMAARDETGYDPGDEANRADLTDPDAPGALAYYTRLRERLQERGSPVAASRREAAAHLADLLYSAYVASGKRLGGPPETEPAAHSPVSYWLLAAGVAVIIMLMLSRRRPRPEPKQGQGG